MAASKERLVVNLEALVAVEAYADTVLKTSNIWLLICMHLCLLEESLPLQHVPTHPLQNKISHLKLVSYGCYHPDFKEDTCQLLKDLNLRRYTAAGFQEL
jgi:hypothetical protein